MIDYQLKEQENMDPYSIFAYGIRSPYTKESYFRRLRGMVCTGSRRYYFYYMEVERKHRDTLIENTGVEPSLTEEEMKGYLEQVLNEMERTSSKRNR